MKQLIGKSLSFREDQHEEIDEYSEEESVSESQAMRDAWDAFYEAWEGNDA